MTTGVTCTVYVEGVRAADGSPGDDLTSPTILDDLAVTWGRSDTMSQPEPDVCTFAVMDQLGGSAFGAQYRTGLRVDVVARGDTYPDPTVSTFTNPGFETATITWSATSASATRSTRRFQSGAYALAVKPDVAGAPGSVLLAPGELQAPGTNPDAWDTIPVTSVGQRWAWSIGVWAPVGMTATVQPVRFTGPYSAAASPVGPPGSVDGNGAWQTVTGERTVQLDDQWVGLLVTLHPTGPAWDEMPPTLTWDAVPADLAWDDYGQAFLDNVLVTSPDGATGRGVLVFSGRITDLGAAWDDTTGSPVVQVACAGFTADLENRNVGEEPWSVESVDVRAHRILDLAGLPIAIDIDTSIDETLVSWRDVDSQGATGLLRELAVSVDGVLWPAVHQSLGAYLRLEDPSLRASLLQLDELLGPAPVVERTQWVRNPGMRTNATGYAPGGAGAGGTSAGARVAGAGFSGGYAWVKTWSVPPTSTANLSVDFAGTTGPIATDNTVLPGSTVYTMQVRFWTNVAGQYNLATVERNAAGGNSSVRYWLHTCVAGWNLLTVTTTSVATTAAVRGSVSQVGGAIPTTSTQWRVSEPMVEHVGSTGTYFDGATPDTPTRNYAWTGPADASTSTQSTVQTHTIVIVQTDPATGFDLSACQVLRDPVSWVQTVADVVTRVAVSWKVQGVDDEGNPTTTESTVHEIDAGLEVTHGTRRVSVTTQLQSADDATDVAARILARTSPADWRAEGLTVDDEDIPAGTTGVGLLLDLLDGTSRIGAPVVLGELPSWSPAGAMAGVYLEGGTYRFVGGRWVLELLVSSASGLGQSAAWDELDPAWTWDQWDPSITWNDLRGVAAP